MEGKRFTRRGLWLAFAACYLSASCVMTPRHKEAWLHISGARAEAQSFRTTRFRATARCATKVAVGTRSDRTFI